MSVSSIRRLINELASDHEISLAEVQQLIDAANEDATVTPGEAFLLQAALEAHAKQFTPDGYAALQRFLESAGGRS